MTYPPNPEQSAVDLNGPSDDTLATPEGDNEFRPGQPLPPVEPAPLRPRGDQPHSQEPLYPRD